MRKEASIDAWRDLYKIAEEIKQLEPWNYLWDMDLFYLVDEDAYVSVLGHAGSTYGISVYEGERGLNDFKILACQSELNLSPQFAMFLQNNLTCYWGDREELSKKQRDIIKELGYKFRGRNRWLYFMSFKIDFVPFNYDADEVERMTKYLSAFKKAFDKYLSEKPEVNFEAREVLCYSAAKNEFSVKVIAPEPGFYGMDITSDLDLVRKLKQLPRKNYSIETDIIPMNIAIDDKSFDRPANPMIALVVDKNSGEVLMNDLSSPENPAFYSLMNTLLNAFFNYGIPKQIYVGNRVVDICLADLCRLLKVKVTVDKHLPSIENFAEGMMEFYNR